MRDRRPHVHQPFIDYSHAGNVDWMERNQKQEISLKRVWKSLCNLCRMVKNRKTWNQESLCRNLYHLVRFADNYQFLRPAWKFQDQLNFLYLLLRYRSPYMTLSVTQSYFWSLGSMDKICHVCIPSHGVFKRGMSVAGSWPHSSGQADEWGCRVKVRIFSLLLCPHHWPGRINPSSSQLRILWLSPKGA